MDLANTWVALLGGLVIILGAMAAGFRWLLHHLGGISEFIQDWAGEAARPGVPARPGVMSRIQDVQDRLQAVEHELKPNSGLSLRDAVDRVEAHTEQMLP